MDASKLKQTRRRRRKLRVRKRVSGTAERPRVTVYRSLKHIYAQAIDDTVGHTIASASSRDGGFSGDGGNKAGAAQVGAALAERLKAKGIEAATFDRNGFKYHGRVQALAEAMREAGVKL
jgi:large subunit ribosomal protein L18